MAPLDVVGGPGAHENTYGTGLVAVSVSARLLNETDMPVTVQSPRPRLDSRGRPKAFPALRSEEGTSFGSSSERRGAVRVSVRLPTRTTEETWT